jgi:hypothetical protein
MQMAQMAIDLMHLNWVPLMAICKVCCHWGSKRHNKGYTNVKQVVDSIVKEAVAIEKQLSKKVK